MFIFNVVSLINHAQNKISSSIDFSDVFSKKKFSSSIRQRLKNHIAFFSKRQKIIKNKLFSIVLIDVNDLIVENEQQFKILNRKIKWLIFLYHSNFLWLKMLREMYENDVFLNDRRMKNDRNKIKNCEKNYQYATLKRMKIWKTFEM